MSRAQSSASSAALNVVYLLSSDVEEEDIKEEPSDMIKQEEHDNDLRALPLDQHSSTSQGKRREREQEQEEVEVEETLKPRKSARLHGKETELDPHPRAGSPSAFPDDVHARRATYDSDDDEEKKPEVFYVSSDSEHAPPSPSKVGSPPPKRSRRMFMDSVVLPRRPPPLAKKKVAQSAVESPTRNARSQHPVAGPSQETHGAVSDRSHPTGAPKGSTSAHSPSKRAEKQPVHPPERPSWLQKAITDVKREHPNVRLKVFYLEDGPRWGVKCLICPDSKIICTGPGYTLRNFVSHVNGLVHRGYTNPTWHLHSEKGKQANPPQPSSPDTIARQGLTFRPIASKVKSQKPKPAATKIQGKAKSKVVAAAPPPPSHEDAVERFLLDMGLSADLADALRHVGIKDEARMKALGRLSDAVLDRLEKSLADEGLDLSACLLVREGLKQRAAAA